MLSKSIENDHIILMKVKTQIDSRINTWKVSFVFVSVLKVSLAIIKMHNSAVGLGILCYCVEITENQCFSL